MYFVEKIGNKSPKIGNDPFSPVALALFKQFPAKHWHPDWRPIEYFFRVLNDSDRQSDTRAMATFIVSRACDVVTVSSQNTQERRTMQDIIYDHCFKATRVLTIVPFNYSVN